MEIRRCRWSWDITKVKGPAPRIFYRRYVMIDVYSRYVVGWVLSEHETGEQAEASIQARYERQGVGPGPLAVHAAAHAAHPERFVKGQPKARPVPQEVWINKPAAPEAAG